MDQEICPQSGKVMFRTRAPAERVLQHMNRKTHSNIGSVYRCQFCHTYHVTHWNYDAQDTIERMVMEKKPPKKLLRSQRLRDRKREKRESRIEFRGDTLIHDNFRKDTMKHIIPINPNTDPQRLSSLMSQGFGEVKLFVGGTLNCALVVLLEAITQLQALPTCRHRAKQLVARTMQEWRSYEARLKSTSADGLRFFHLQDLDPVYRKRYGENVTDEQYFEFWQGTGGEMYAVCLPHINAYTYKLERYFQRIQSPHAHAYALAMVAHSLMELSCMTYRYSIENVTRELPGTVPSFRDLCEPFNPERIHKPFREAIGLIFLDAMPPFTNEEQANVKLSLDQISEIWTDPLTFMDIQEKAIESYTADVFRTKGEAKKLIRLNAEKRQHIAQTMLEQKRQEFLKTE